MRTSYALSFALLATASILNSQVVNAEDGVLTYYFTPKENGLIAKRDEGKVFNDPVVFEITRTAINWQGIISDYIIENIEKGSEHAEGSKRDTRTPQKLTQETALSFKNKITLLFGKVQTEISLGRAQSAQKSGPETYYVFMWNKQKYFCVFPNSLAICAVTYPSTKKVLQEIRVSDARTELKIFDLPKAEDVSFLLKTVGMLKMRRALDGLKVGVPEAKPTKPVRKPKFEPKLETIAEEEIPTYMGIFLKKMGRVLQYMCRD